MFETLTKGFRAARNRLAGLTELTEDNVEQALRDVRVSLLEADVELGVVKRFLARVKEDVVGLTVVAEAEIRGRKVRAGPAERFIKACQDELENMMRGEGDALTFAPGTEVTGVLMVGLQGSGKTTTSAKIASHLERKFGRKVLLVAADVQRPGAIEQLQVLGERVDIPVFAIPGGLPPDICEKALAQARKLKRDTIVYDTAGRLAVDDALMGELGEIQRRVSAKNVLLVVDAMIGQDAVKTAATFHERLGLTGVVLTKLDGDARGGAALAIKEVTGAPIRFVGTGESLDKIEEFRPEGMASRILGFGDVVGLMRDFEEVVDHERAEDDARRMLQGQFTLDDFLTQIETLQKMGPLQGVLEKLPFFGDSLPEGFQVDDRELHRTKAIVSSMTREERRNTDLFQRQPSRLRRVAKGSGRSEEDVAELLQRFGFMRQMMGDIGNQAGMLSRIPGFKQIAMARKLRDVVRTGGLDENPMMANLANQLLEAAVAGENPTAGLFGGAGGMAGAAPRSRPVDREKKKSLRKMQKKSRKKSRK